jgi:hypothetical protein
VPGGNGIPFLEGDLHCLNCQKERFLTSGL